MEKKVIYKKPKMIRRFGTALIDLILAVVLAFLVSLITNPILNKIYDINTLESKRNEYITSTKLYQLNDQNELEVIYSVAKADENLTYFYKNCIDKYDEYNTIKKESGLFVLENDNYIINSTIDLNDTNTRIIYQNFFDEVIENTIINHIDEYLNSIDDYVLLTTRLEMVLVLNIIICALFGFIISYVVIPLIINGKTLGKIMFHINLISISSYETKLTKLQIIFRGLITIVFEYLLCLASIITFNIPIPIGLVISICLMLLTKYNQSLHDLCCQTILIDNDYNNSNLNASEKYVITYYNVKD